METVSLSKDGRKISLVLNSDIAVVDGKYVKLDAPAIVTGGRTLVPARFLAELFGYSVTWQEAGNVIIIEAAGGR